MKKSIIIPIILLLAFGIYQGFFKKEKPTFTLAEVTRGTVSQEISEAGQVKKGEEINLSFRNAGRVEKIYVEVGEKVKKGDILAKLETTSLKIQLQEAKANLSLGQVKLNKLLAGATKEEIQIAQTQVSNAKIALENTQQNLKDIRAQAEENLNQAYEDALNTLDDAYLKAYNSQTAIATIQRAYFIKNDQEGIRVRENKEKIESAVSQIKFHLDTAKTNPIQENIDLALSQIKAELSNVSDALKIIREICETPEYRNTVTSTDKSSLDGYRTNINTALTNITNSQQTIALTKLTNEANINTAQAKVSSAEGSLKAAEDELARITAPPRQEDVDLYQAQVNQAQAQVQLLENQIEEAVLVSPINSQVTKIPKRAGETVQPMVGDIIISLLPDTPFQIEVDIYEEDVVKMKIGNLVDISLVAFPEKTFKGKVLNIDPAEKIIEGVVYYKIIIAFEEAPEGIKPGMTADLTIKTASKENVLIISKDAIQRKDGKTMVKVFKDGSIEEREIEIGLQGSDNLVEVISGLAEGEDVILR